MPTSTTAFGPPLVKVNDPQEQKVQPVEVLAISTPQNTTIRNPAMLHEAPKVNFDNQLAPQTPAYNGNKADVNSLFEQVGGIKSRARI